MRGRLGVTEDQAHHVTVFDTVGLDLRAAGITAALTRDGDRLAQRVTIGGRNDGTSPLVHETAFTGAIDLRHVLAVLPPPVVSAVREQGLHPMFAVRYTRSQAQVPAAAPVLDAILDTGVVVVGAAEIPFAELGIGPNSDPAGVAALQRLLADIPVRLAAEDRWERGYRLASGIAPRAFHARVAPVAPRAKLGEAAAQLLRQAFTHFIRNLPAASVRGDSDAVHQMRVGMRRLNACIAIFPRVLDPALVDDVRALRRLFESLAQVRECDVFLDETLPHIPAVVLPAAERSALEVSVRLHRASALGSLRRAFDGPDLAMLVASLDLRLRGRGWCRRNQPLDDLGPHLAASEFAARRIRALHRRLLRSEPADLRDVEGWHDARKRAKRLRYATEPLLAAYPARTSRTARYARRLTKLQDVLGNLNDLRMASDLIARLSDAPDTGVPIRVQDAVRAFAAERIDQALPKARSALHRVGDAFPALRRSARQPFVLAVVGVAGGYAGPVAAQIAAAWSEAGLRTGIVESGEFPRLLHWREQRPPDRPGIRVHKPGTVRRGDAKGVQRLLWPVVPSEKRLCQVARRASAAVVPLTAATLRESHAIVHRLRDEGIPVFVVAVATGAIAPVRDATAVLRWMPLYRGLARSGGSVFDGGDGAVVEAQADWMPLLTAIETFAPNRSPTKPKRNA